MLGLLALAAVVFIAFVYYKLGRLHGRKQGHAEGAAFALSELTPVIADLVERASNSREQVERARGLVIRTREQAEQLAEATHRGRGNPWN